MKMMDLIKNYEAPMVEIVEVEVEKGFATSNENEGIGQGPIYPLE